MGYVTIFPRRLFASILREQPKVAPSTLLVESARLDATGVFLRLGTRAEGLSDDEAQQRLAQYPIVT